MHATPFSIETWLISDLEIASDAFKDIIIHLQGTLLTHLGLAQEDDNMTDFSTVLDASDFGRIRSVTVLNELYMRMAQAAPLAPSPIPIREPTAGLGLDWRHDERAAPGIQSPWASQGPSERQGVGDVSESNAQSTDSTRTQDFGTPLVSTRRKWSLFGSKDRKASLKKTSAGSNGPLFSTLTSNPVRNFSPPNQYDSHELSTEKPSPPFFGGSLSLPSSQSDGAFLSPSKSSPVPSIDEENPWQSEHSAFSPTVPQSGSPEVESRRAPFMARKQSTEATTLGDDEVPLPESKPTKRLYPYKHRQSNSEGTQIPASRTLTGGSTDRQAKSPTVSRTTSSQIPTSLAKNPYGGFCKGAYKMQVGLKKESMSLRNQSTSMTGQSHYWACASSKCAFEGGACKLSKGWDFDHTIRSAYGVQYRWTFLAKSHVAMSKVKNSKYDYQCIFCTIQDQPVILHTDKVFIEHVSHHRGQRLDATVFEKMGCITGRVALENEDFDINLTPLEPDSDSGLDVVESSDVFSYSPDQLHTDRDERFAWSTVQTDTSNPDPWKGYS